MDRGLFEDGLEGILMTLQIKITAGLSVLMGYTPTHQMRSASYVSKVQNFKHRLKRTEQEIFSPCNCKGGPDIPLEPGDLPPPPLREFY